MGEMSFLANTLTFTYDGTTCPICFNPYGLKRGGFWAHVPTCTILNASFPSWCIVSNLCCVKHRYINDYMHMFNLEHCMSLHWEYNVENAPGCERKWGIN
jgi:hypothetical protein